MCSAIENACALLNAPGRARTPPASFEMQPKGRNSERPRTPVVDTTPLRRSEVGVRIGIASARMAAGMLSRLGIGAMRAMGTGGGALASCLNGRAAHVTRVNVDRVYAHKDPAWRRRLVRQSLQQTAMTLFEAAALWTWPLPRLAKLLKSSEGEDLLRNRAPGRGAVVLIPHFGNWEFLGYHLNTIEPLTPLYQRRRSQAVDEALSVARNRLGSRSAGGSVSGLRNLVKALRSGGMVAILPDQVPSPDSGLVVPFFGLPALTMSLVSKLLQRSDIEIVVGTATRVRGGFSIRIEAIDDAVRNADPLVSARTINAAIETVVARDRAQYQWEYKRYRLPDEPDIYKQRPRDTRRSATPAS